VVIGIAVGCSVGGVLVIISAVAVILHRYRKQIGKEQNDMEVRELLCLSSTVQVQVQVRKRHFLRVFY